MATEIMNSLDRSTLRKCEKIISAGMVTFLDVGEALCKIRDEKLYREKYSSFKTYCKEKWEFSDSRARQLIGGSEIAKGVESVTRVTLSNEKQARPLAKLPEEERSAAWNEAVEVAGGKAPTAKQVEQVVNQRLGDDTGEDDDSEGIPEEPISQPPRKGKDKPVDLGKCPNCAGAKWDEDDDGWYCAKCRHPHGEPAGDVDDDRLKTQRQKTVKTAEALMRAFDDLQCMKARPEHDKAIETCKGLLEIARAWK